MENHALQVAIAAVVSDEFSESDVRTIRHEIEILNREEHSLRRRMERDTNQFVRNKDRNQSNLRRIRNAIRELKLLIKK